MLHILNGDLLCADADFICHQVNCRSVMGAGVAKAIYTKWPEVKAKYHEFCSKSTPEELLGKIQIVDVYDLRIDSVINIFGQLNYGRGKAVYTDYTALQHAFSEINRVCCGKSIAFPYGFACGLAGGDWIEIEKLMLQNLQNCDVKIYFLAHFVVGRR